jgi:hypothetical protein
MANRPSDLAERMSDRNEPVLFRLPVEAARTKVREILKQFPQGGYMTVVEQWRQLSDGQIEFTVQRLPMRKARQENLRGTYKSRRTCLAALQRAGSIMQNLEGSRYRSENVVDC